MNSKAKLRPGEGSILPVRESGRKRKAGAGGLGVGAGMAALTMWVWMLPVERWTWMGAGAACGAGLGYFVGRLFNAAWGLAVGRMLEGWRRRAARHELKTVCPAAKDLPATK